MSSDTHATCIAVRTTLQAVEQSVREAGKCTQHGRAMT